MSVITRMRNQTAVLWKRDGVDSLGQPTYEAPVEIDVRWVDGAEEFVDENGERQASDAIVYPDRDVPIGSMLLGTGTGSITLADLASDTSPQANNAKPVLSYKHTPNFKATETLRKVLL